MAAEDGMVVYGEIYECCKIKDEKTNRKLFVKRTENKVFSVSN